jgi:hypothetical protein
LARKTKAILTLIGAGLTFALPRLAHGEATPTRASVPRLGYSVQLHYPTSLDTGKTGTPTTSHAVNLFVPWTTVLAWRFEGGINTPYTTFQPAPQVSTGPRFRLTEGVGIGLTVVYRYTPSYAGLTTGNSHSLATSLSLSLLLSGGFVLSFPVTLSHNLTRDTNTIGVGVKFVVPVVAL